MKTTFLIIGGLVAAFFLVGIIARANDPLTGEKDRARAAIDLCDKGVKDELSPMGTRRMVRGVCDSMRGEYKTKYGTSP